MITRIFSPSLDSQSHVFITDEGLSYLALLESLPFHSIQLNDILSLVFMLIQCNEMSIFVGPTLFFNHPNL